MLEATNYWREKRGERRILSAPIHAYSGVYYSTKDRD
jgi:hypothetical protein